MCLGRTPWGSLEWSVRRSWTLVRGSGTHLCALGCSRPFDVPSHLLGTRMTVDAQLANPDWSQFKHRPENPSEQWNPLTSQPTSRLANRRESQKTPGQTISDQTNSRQTSQSQAIPRPHDPKLRAPQVRRPTSDDDPKSGGTRSDETNLRSDAPRSCEHKSDDPSSEDARSNEHGPDDMKFKGPSLDDPEV